MPKAHNSESLESVRHSLVNLRRLFQRKDLAQLWASAFGRHTRLDYSGLRLLDAVGIAQPATVGDIAQRLGIDPSRASRQVSQAIRRGLLRRRAEPGDARKVVVEITAVGAALQRKGAELTRARIALALDSWSAADRATFARLFARFTERITSS